ncbi:hypothetical protein PLESTB_000623100 [Pleodorina starrii]|uniref:Uncharacterized protein n=1 Tax=Pleodorina starrii TaxID=330485 RepID=A0A9W6BI16_9CHLO|nr:hypothetical protein PLESTB_000623100 [Pleodorina starrii]
MSSLKRAPYVLLDLVDAGSRRLPRRRRNPPAPRTARRVGSPERATEASDEDIYSKARAAATVALQGLVPVATAGTPPPPPTSSSRDSPKLDEDIFSKARAAATMALAGLAPVAAAATPLPTSSSRDPPKSPATPSPPSPQPPQPPTSSSRDSPEMPATPPESPRASSTVVVSAVASGGSDGDSPHADVAGATAASSDGGDGGMQKTQSPPPRIFKGPLPLYPSLDGYGCLISQFGGWALNGSGEWGGLRTAAQHGTGGHVGDSVTEDYMLLPDDLMLSAVLALGLMD